MNETKHTPLPWMKQLAVNQETFKDYVELYRPPGYPNEPIGTLCPYLHDAEANADLILTSVNTSPKVEELVRLVLADSILGNQVGWRKPTNEEWLEIIAKAREVEAALGGKAECHK